MAMVNFKKGLLANLPASKSEGTFYVTTDERALYLDLSNDVRVRIGDFQEFATVAALQANTNPSTTVLYYITELNCLAKWNGSAYIKINLDTGATSVEKTGEGNALSGVSYDPATRKLTFTTISLLSTDDVDNKINTKIGEIGEPITVKAYIDTKIGTVDEGKTVVQMIDEVKTTAASDDSELRGRISTLEGEDAHKSVRGIANEEISAQLVPDNAKTELNTVPKIAAWIQKHPDEYASLVAILAGFPSKTVYYTDENGLIADASGDPIPIEQSSYGSDGYVYAVPSGIDPETGKKRFSKYERYGMSIPELGSEYFYEDYPPMAQALDRAAHKEGVDTVVEYVTNAINALQIGDYAKATELTALAARTTTLEGSDAGKSIRTIANEELAAQLIPENAQESLDTLTEIATWIQNHPNDAAAMNTAITHLQSVLEGIGSGEGGYYKNENAVFVDMDGNPIVAGNQENGDPYYLKLNPADSLYYKCAIDGDITFGGASWASTLQSTDPIVTAVLEKSHYDPEPTVIAHVDRAINFALKEYASAKTLDSLKNRVTQVESKAHEHSNKAELDKIMDGDKAKWDSSEQNAKDYADELMEWGVF